MLCKFYGISRLIMKGLEAVDIYFHVGLGKTASTYLQNKVFDKFKGIVYVHPTKYRKYAQIIAEHTGEKLFISREMDQQLEREVKKFSEQYPDTKSMIVLRSNAQWIASQYRRFLKNGYPYTFEEFFDIENDRGFWKIAAAEFYPKIQILEKYFTQKPLVLFYEDLRAQPFQFIDSIANYLGVTYDKNAIPLEPHHTSYEEKQLKVMLGVSKYVFTKNPQYKGSYFNTWIRRRSRMVLCYIILYTALIIPKFLLSKKPLITPESLEKIKKYYATDWANCIAYAGK